jgi:hypothetical protein
MGESQGPDYYANDVFGFDEVFGFNVEMIPCPENIDALIAWSAAKSKTSDTESAEDTATETKKSDAPDCPAA